MWLAASDRARSAGRDASLLIHEFSFRRIFLLGSGRCSPAPRRGDSGRRSELSRSMNQDRSFASRLFERTFIKVNPPYVYAIRQFYSTVVRRLLVWWPNRRFHIFPL